MCLQRDPKLAFNIHHQLDGIVQPVLPVKLQKVTFTAKTQPLRI